MGFLISFVYKDDCGECPYRLDMDWHLSIFPLATHPLDQTTALLKNEYIHRNLPTLSISPTLISHLSCLHHNHLLPSRPLSFPLLNVRLPFNKLRLQILSKTSETCRPPQMKQETRPSKEMHRLFVKVAGMLQLAALWFEKFHLS